MKKLMNLFMVFLFATAIVACGGNADTEAEAPEADTTAVQQDVAPEVDTTAADTTAEEGHDEAGH